VIRACILAFVACLAAAVRLPASPALAAANDAATREEQTRHVYLRGTTLVGIERGE
jgi:hypothetical protein